MQKGYIPSYKSPGEWIPEGSKPSPIAFKYSKNGVPLFNKFSWVIGGIYKSDAYYCAKCGVVIAYTKPE